MIHAHPLCDVSSSVSRACNGAINKLGGFLLVTTLTATLTLTAAAQTPSFQGLGQMPGAMRGTGTFAVRISNDGSTIVGYAWVCPNGGTTCNSSGKTEAYRWTAVGKYQVLGDLGSSVGSMAFAASSNGSIVVGEAPKGQNSFGAFRWTAAQGMVALPVSMLHANAVTADGSMVVGGDSWWKTSGQTGIFGPFPGNQDQTQASGVSGTSQAPVAVGAALKGSDPMGQPFTLSAGHPVEGCRIWDSPQVQRALRSPSPAMAR